MDPLLSLIAGSVAFVGTHFVLSHPLRVPLVSVIGENGFRGLYSLVALATFVWAVLAFRAVGPGGTPLWNGMGDGIWI
ncbi:MAG: MFS transporter, partial [Actinobacteria bacterium]|nr:MFS transporter [Actinomycetota bacterium]